MRKYDVAYVANGPVNYYPAPKLEDMSYEEIVKKYIKTCGKANGLVSECSKCTNPCREGKRAIQLLANEVYNDPPVPLYGGKTLIEKAREENKKRREEMENKTEPKKRTMCPRMSDWWEKSIESGDQVKWLMTEMGLSRTAAKKKIYHYKYDHGMLKTEKEESVKEEPVVKIVEKVPEIPKAEVKVPDMSTIEEKLEKLMKEQEEHAKAMEKYMELYNKEKEIYEKIKAKADVLCNAMDILND